MSGSLVFFVHKFFLPHIIKEFICDKSKVHIIYNEIIIEKSFKSTIKILLSILDVQMAFLILRNK